MAPLPKHADEGKHQLNIMPDLTDALEDEVSTLDKVLVEGKTLEEHKGGYSKSRAK